MDSRINLEGYRDWAYGRGYVYFVYAHASRGRIFYVGMGEYFRPYNFGGRNKRWKEHVASLPGRNKDVEVIRLSRHRKHLCAQMAEGSFIAFYKPACNIYKPLFRERRKRKARTA